MFSRNAKVIFGKRGLASRALAGFAIVCLIVLGGIFAGGGRLDALIGISSSWADEQPAQSVIELAFTQPDRPLAPSACILGNWSSGEPIGPGTPRPVHLRWMQDADGVRPTEIVVLTTWRVDFTDPLGDGENDLVLENPAGSFTLTRSPQTGERTGSFRFAPNADLARAFAEDLGAAPTASQWLQAFGAQLDAAYLRAIHVCVAGNPDIAAVLRLRLNGITTELAAALHAAGYLCDADTIIRLRNHGVTTEDATRPMRAEAPRERLKPAPAF